MPIMNVVKLDTLPGTLVANTVYLIKPTNSLLLSTFRTIVTDDEGVPYESISSFDFKRQHFNLKIQNVNGVLKHSIFSTLDDSYDSRFASCVSGHTHVPTVTPVGTDSTTDFAGGVKISSIDNTVIILHTQEIDLALDVFTIFIVDRNTIVLDTAVLDISSRNINGVTRKYLALKFSSPIESGMLPTNGDYIVLTVIGYSNPY